MEDEEYYHMMMSDLERLERIHHHQNPEIPPPSSSLSPLSPPSPRQQAYHWNPSYFDNLYHSSTHPITPTTTAASTQRYGTTTTISSAASSPGAAESGSGSGNHRPPSPILAGLKSAFVAGLDVLHLHLHHPHRPSSAHSNERRHGLGTESGSIGSIGSTSKKDRRNSH